MSQGLRIAPPEAPVVSVLDISSANISRILYLDGIYVWQRSILCRYEQ